MWEVSSYQWIVSYEEYSGCRPRRVDAELDPAGRSKDLVGKGLDTVRARLARRSILQYISLQKKFLKSSKFWAKQWNGINFTYHFQRFFWKYQKFYSLCKKSSKKTCWHWCFSNTLPSAWFFKKPVCAGVFETQIPTLQLDINF